MKKLKKTVLVTAVMSLTMAGTAFAGTWKTGATGENQDSWWYDNGNGSYTSNGWQWIDGNEDGIAECYYFDGNGWMLANTTTPDGYSVNENGAWVENGVVQTKQVNANNNTNTTVMLNEGVYRYYKADFFDENTQTLVCSGQVYDGTSESLNSILINDRYPYQRLADPMWELYIYDVTDNSFMISESETSVNGWGFAKDGDKWRNSFYRTYENWAEQKNLIDYPAENIDSEEYYQIIDENTMMYHDTYSVVNTETGEPIGQKYTETRIYKRIK